MAHTLKSHSGAGKRFKLTKKGKVTFNKVGNSHLLTNKGKSNKKAKYGKVLDTTYTKQIKNLLPYN